MFKPLRIATTATRRRLAGAVRRDARLWINRLDRQERPLPDTVILGAQKAGTTTLYDLLSVHPGMVPSYFKEVHYFDLNAARGEAWYRLNFPPRPNPEDRVLEASPYYLFHPAVPARVAEALPQARFLVILRDPVHRALSHYHHARRRGFEPLATFGRAVAAEEARLAGADATLEAGADAVHFAHQHQSYVARGFYHAQLMRWCGAVGRDRLHVIDLDALTTDTVNVMAGVSDFLEIDPVDWAFLPHSNSAAYKVEDSDGTLDRLAAIYAPDTSRLIAEFGVGQNWMSAPMGAAPEG